MDWTAAIDAYCERTSDAFWAEPFNALTNLGFLAAATFGLRIAGRDGRADSGVLVLAMTAALVGFGSFAFHTFATRWAALADVIPIGFFIAVAVYLGLKRLAGVAPHWAMLGTAGFMAVSPLIARLVDPVLGSSAGYAAALLVMPAMAVAGWRRERPGSGMVMAAGGMFALSLALRMADDGLCPWVPFGTHFAWHLLNALVLAMVMTGLATAERSSADA